MPIRLRLRFSIILVIALAACTSTSESSDESTTAPEWHTSNEVDATCRASEGDAARVSSCFQIADILYEDGCSIRAFRQVIQNIDDMDVRELDLRKYGCRTLFQGSTTTSQPTTTTIPTTSTSTSTTSTTSVAAPTQRSQSTATSITWETLTEATNNTHTHSRALSGLLRSPHRS